MEHIIDPDLLGNVKPYSFSKFGETQWNTKLNLVHIPSTGEVQRNLENALHLHEPVIQAKQYHPYWRAITTNMQMRVKKKKSNNLNSKRKKWSVGKTTEKKEFFKLQYTHPVMKTSRALESLCKILFFITEKSACDRPMDQSQPSNSVDSGPAPLPFST